MGLEWSEQIIMVKSEDNYLNLSKCLKKYDFETVYSILDKQDFIYSLDNIVNKFPKCDAILLYAFLMYSIAKNETVEKHIAICECLIFIDPFIYESDSMIYWHIMRALSLKKENIKVMLWVIEVYGENPSSPFSYDEINSFAKSIIEQEPDNIIAQAILRNSLS